MNERQATEFRQRGCSVVEQLLGGCEGSSDGFRIQVSVFALDRQELSLQSS